MIRCDLELGVICVSLFRGSYLLQVCLFIPRVRQLTNPVMSLVGDKGMVAGDGGRFIYAHIIVMSGA